MANFKTGQGKAKMSLKFLPYAREERSVQEMMGTYQMDIESSMKWLKISIEINNGITL